MKTLYAVGRHARARAAGVVRGLRRFLRRDEGASLVEYALLVALIALVAIVSVVALGTKINNVFNNMVANLTSNNVN